VDSISGMFVLGTGSIRGKEYYRSFRIMEDGSFKRADISTSESVIVEDNSVSPRVEWEEYKYERKWWCKFGFGFADLCYGDHNHSGYRIIVPNGTVIQQFKVD